MVDIELEKINIKALESRLKLLDEAIKSKSINDLVYSINNFSKFIDTTSLSEKNKQKYNGFFYIKLNEILKDNWEYLNV